MLRGKREYNRTNKGNKGVVVMFLWDLVCAEYREVVVTGRREILRMLDVFVHLCFQ